MSSKKVCLAAIAGAHGVQGLVRIKSFTEQPEDAAAYGQLSDESGKRQFRLTLKGRNKGLLLAAIAGVTDRSAAEALKGLRLYVEREALPPTDDPEEFYHADLIGLAVEDRQGNPLGTVHAVEDYGAGSVLEVRDAERTLMLPFTLAAVPVVDLAGGRLVADPPDEIEASQDGKVEPAGEAENGS